MICTTGASPGNIKTKETIEKFGTNWRFAINIIQT